MASPTSTSPSLSLAVAHAVSFLTSPLNGYRPQATVIKLQLVLEANLIALYGPTWSTDDPLSGSASRILSLSPHCLPSRPIYSACVASGVPWCEWIALLGNQALELLVDPGRVVVCYGQEEPIGRNMLIVWSEQSMSPASRTTRPVSSSINVHRAMQVGSHQHSKTAAQQLLENDHQVDDQVFAMITDEMNDPTLATPVNNAFPQFSRPLSPVSTISAHSRCSSRSSNSSSGFSYTSGQSSSTSFSSNSTSASQGWKQSRREKARHARVFVDTTKTEVTPYDGGKTTVLTGGVMLGGAQRRPTKVKAQHTW